MQTTETERNNWFVNQSPEVRRAINRQVEATYRAQYAPGFSGPRLMRFAIQQNVIEQAILIVRANCAGTPFIPYL